MRARTRYRFLLVFMQPTHTLTQYILSAINFALLWETVKQYV